VLLWGYLDDRGRGLDVPKGIAGDLFPRDDDVTPKLMDAWLEQMTIGLAGRPGPLCRYEVDGVRYLHCVNWSEHQRVDRPTASTIPPCPLHESSSNHSRGHREQIREASAMDSLPGDGDGDGDGDGVWLFETPPSPPPRPDDEFDRFWKTYPRREAKGAARKAWDKAITRAPAGLIIAAAGAYRDRPGRKPEYTAHPASWLNQDRWTDEPNVDPAPPQPAPSTTDARMAQAMAAGDRVQAMLDAQTQGAITDGCP
jgi:hypothetical protein